MHFFIIFIATMISAFVCDMLWLGLIATNLYAENIGFLLRKSGTQMTPIWSAAMLVYVAISMGILLFVLPKAGGSYAMAFVWGALFGAVMYGVYDFTNYSILANWPLKITLIDFLWGILLCGLTGMAANFVQNKLG